MSERTYHVRCSCGYEAGPFPSRRAALDEADEHVLALAGADEPEGAHRPEIVEGLRR